ncbi:MAG: hypothetical protein ACAH59_14470 [Pseudobdellovibrionaceae bacterium]
MKNPIYFERGIVMQILIIPVLVLLLAACSSSQTKSDDRGWVPQSSSPKGESVPSTTPAREEINVDEVGLQKWLGLNSSPEHLGYREKSFNTCEVGFGYSKSHNCQKQHFVVINYRLQCRDSEGTVQKTLSQLDLRDIASEDVRWNLSSQKGVSRTNGDGYGQIRGIFSGSQKQQRLRMALNNEVLFMRAGEVTQLVTPQSWCP